MRAKCFCVFLAAVFLAFPAGPGFSEEKGRTPVTLTVAVAASLRHVVEDEIIPLFREKYPWITVEGSYDGSGKLQVQIENGLDADIFISAGERQMTALVEKNLIDPGSVLPLLGNRIVLIRPVGWGCGISSFSDVRHAGMVALGDPESVPAGQYAREVFTWLGVWDEIRDKASFGTNVTEVLNWVAEGSAEVGVVYATDAAVSRRVAVICEAPAGSPGWEVVYPVGVLPGGSHREEAGLFVEFLVSLEASEIFSGYGFR